MLAFKTDLKSESFRRYKNLAKIGKNKKKELNEIFNPFYAIKETTSEGNIYAKIDYFEKFICIVKPKIYY